MVPSVVVFPKAPCLLLRCPSWDSFSSLIFASSDASGATCSLTCAFGFLVVLGVCRTSSKTLLQRIIFLFSAFFTAVFASVSGNQEYEGVDDLSPSL